MLKLTKKFDIEADETFENPKILLKIITDLIKKK